jgi:archaellum component FlaF (FlaF/FlaG flagellin family)
VKNFSYVVSAAMLLVIVFVSVAFAPASQPASQPSSQPAVASLWAVILAWLIANWKMVVLVYLVPSLLVGVQNYEKGTGFMGFLKAALQWMSFLVPKNSPGTTKMPFTKAVAPMFPTGDEEKKG